MKKMLFLFLGLIGAVASAAVTATVNRAQQRFPWNGKIDVDFTLSGTMDNAGYRLDLALVDGDREYAAATFDTEPFAVGDGAHRVTWDFGKDHPEIALTNVTVRLGVAPLADTDPFYLVFDLSGGKDATSYPHRYTMTPPDLSSDVCRTTEFWMRRVPAGQFTQGYTDSLTAYAQAKYWLPPHQVKLSKAYYLAIFEMTQKQYELLTGERPSYFTAEWETRPVEQTSYQLIRGTAGWYDNPPTMSSSAKLYGWRGKFGFSRLDFPTEAQWEHAARAGAVDRSYNMVVKAQTLGRNYDAYPADGVTATTLPKDGGTAKVGSYQANAWGFYDMMGNVAELTGDGNPVRNTTTETVELSDYAPYDKDHPRVDPRGPTQEMVNRRSDVTLTYDGAVAQRGGSWNEAASHMLLYFRDQRARSIGSGTWNYLGFRLCITCD